VNFFANLLELVLKVFIKRGSSPTGSINESRPQDHALLESIPDKKKSPRQQKWAMRPIQRGSQTAAIVDVETTGFSSSDEIIELSAILLTFERHASEQFSILDSYCGQREQTVQVNRYAGKKHGIKNVELRGQSLDHNRVSAILNKAEFILAHNAPFDKRFVTAMFGQAGSKKWYCTMTGIDWIGHGCATKKLPDLLKHHRIDTGRSHRADSDTYALLQLLGTKSRAGSPYLFEVLK